MKKKFVTAGLAAGLLAGTGAGFALELSGDAGASARSPIVNVASDGTTTDPLGDPAADRAARLAEILAPLVSDGTITQEQADKVIAAIDAAGPIGRGDRGPGGPLFAEVATALGITEDEVRAAVDGGQTLAQLAQANGSSAEELIAALVANFKTHLDEEVAAGTHTQDEADAKLAEMTARVSDLVNNTQSAQMGPDGAGRDGDGPHGPGDGPRGDGDGPHGPVGDVGTGPTGSGDTGTIDGGPTDTPTTQG